MKILIQSDNGVENGFIVSPLEYSGSVYGDYGYEIDGVKSEKGYSSKASAKNALLKKLNKLSVTNSNK